MRTAVALLGLAACSPPVVWIEPPPASGARALLLAVESDGARTLHAYALDGTDTLPAAIRLGEMPDDTHLEALLYRATLDELRITAGEVAPASDPIARALEPADASFVLALRDGRAPGWSATPSMSDGLAAFRYRAPPPACASFDVEVLELDIAADHTFAVLARDDVVLMGTENGNLYRYDRAGGVQRVASSRAATLTGAVRGELGDLFAGGSRGELFRAELGDTLELTLVGTSPSGERLHWFDAGTTDDGLELYSLTVEGSFERFRLGRWVSLTKFPPGVPGDWVGGVARIGSGAAVAAWPTLATVARAAGDAVTDELTPATGGIGSIAFVPELGLVAGTTEGGFLRHDGEAWQELGGSPLSLPVNMIVPYPGGFVYGGPFGNFGQYLDGQFCPLLQPAPHWIRYMVVLGRDVLLAGTNDTYPETPVTLLKRVSR